MSDKDNKDHKVVGFNVVDQPGPYSPEQDCGWTVPKRVGNAGSNFRGIVVVIFIILVVFGVVSTVMMATKRAEISEFKQVRSGRLISGYNYRIFEDRVTGVQYLMVPGTGLTRYFEE